MARLAQRRPSKSRSHPSSPSSISGCGGARSAPRSAFELTRPAPTRGGCPTPRPWRPRPPRPPLCREPPTCTRRRGTRPTTRVCRAPVPGAASYRFALARGATQILSARNAWGPHRHPVFVAVLRPRLPPDARHVPVGRPSCIPHPPTHSVRNAGRLVAPHRDRL